MMSDIASLVHKEIEDQYGLDFYLNTYKNDIQVIKSAPNFVFKDKSEETQNYYAAAIHYIKWYTPGGIMDWFRNDEIVIKHTNDLVSCIMNDLSTSWRTEDEAVKHVEDTRLDSRIIEHVKVLLHKWFTK